MKLPEFIYGTNKKDLDGPVILQTKPPYYIGKVYLFDSRDKYATFHANYTGWHFEPVPGYNIGITLAGTLITDKISFTPEIKHKIKAIMWEMVQFYTEERINNKQGFFKKYQIAKKEDHI
jgi:hypothetical protein